VVEAKRLQVCLVANAAKHLVRQYRRENHIAPASIHNLGCGQYGRDTVARVPRLPRAGVAIVEIEETDHDAVRERGQVGARSLAADHDRCRLHARDTRCEFSRNAGRLACRAAKSAANGVGDKPLGLPHDLRGQVLVTKGRRVRAQLFDDCLHASMIDAVVARTHRMT
jgi:hypothetical protein